MNTINFNISRPQRGIGLVEMMVTMAIGLVMLIALGYFFLGSQQVNRTSEDVSRMQESGRNALELIGRAVRQAGYRSDPNVAFSGTALTGVNSASSAPDTMTIQYEAQEGGETNCIGAAVAAGALVNYAFTISGGALNCNGVVVVSNVEDMQISYGIDSTKDGVIDLYKSQPSSAVEFSQVAAVRVSLLIKGPTSNLTANQSQTYTYNGATVTSTDGFLRQVYSATFTVRNQAW